MSSDNPAMKQPEAPAAQLDASSVLPRSPDNRGYQVETPSAEGTAGQRWLLGPGRHRIGRDQQCAICLPCPSVSRQHVELEVMETGGLVVIDLDSTNGTRINGRRILRQAISGDFELGIGQQRLRFRERRSGKC